MLGRLNSGETSGDSGRQSKKGKKSSVPAATLAKPEAGRVYSICDPHMDWEGWAAAMYCMLTTFAESDALRPDSVLQTTTKEFPGRKSWKTLDGWQSSLSVAKLQLALSESSGAVIYGPNTLASYLETAPALAALDMSECTLALVLDQVCLMFLLVVYKD